MNTKDLIRLGVPVGDPIALAHEFIRREMRAEADLERKIIKFRRR